MRGLRWHSGRRSGVWTETVRLIIDRVRPVRTRFCLEMMQTVPPDSIDSYLTLIEAIDRPAFGVHLDPVNILYAPRDCYDNGRIIAECVRRLGAWIVSCHAKDLVLRPGLALHLDEVRPGLGLLDYPAYLRALASLGRDVPLMLEHLDGADQYQAAGEHLAALLGNSSHGS